MARLGRLLATVLLVALWAGPAAAQYGGDDQPDVAVASTTIAPGGTTTVSGSDFTPGSTATVGLDTTVLASTTTAGDGTFAVSVQIPSTALCGDNTLDITSDAGDAASVGITIACRPVAGDDGRGAVRSDVGGLLADTGGNLTVAGALVLALFTAGGVALYATRRKGALDGG